MTALSDSFADWPAAEKAKDPLLAIGRLGLERNIAELDAYGFTILEPGRAAPLQYVDALEETVLRASQRKAGVAPDKVTGLSHGTSHPTGWGQHMFYMLLEDPIFETALMNETALALISYLVGESCLLSSMTSIVKGPGEAPLGLHTDTAMMPAPFPAYAQVANATWVLSDYSRENGALCFWPGSHAFCRPPTKDEMNATDWFMPVVAPRGSLIVWHGHTWHGAFARTAPGLRINLILYFCRVYMQTQESYRDKISPEAVARNQARFARLLGLDLPYPFDLSGAPYDKIARLNAAARSKVG
jgi:hypothetical protein